MGSADSYANIANFLASINSEETKARRREIRQEFSDMISETRKKGPDVDDDFLDETFNRADQLLDEVQMPREAIYDSVLVNLQANIIKQKTQQLHTSVKKFQPEEFAAKHVAFFNSIKFGTPKKRSSIEIFRKSGYISKRIISTCPSFNFLYIDVGSEPVPKKLRQARMKKDEISKVIEKPKTINLKNANDLDEEITDAAERTFTVLLKLHERSTEPLCYFSFVVNPKSYAETIENMFYVSVLAKEGAVGLGLDGNGVPTIEPISGDRANDIKVHGNYSQSILSITPEEFKRIVKVFNIQNAVLTRKKK